MQAGDTLYSLANRYGLTLAELKEINDLSSDLLMLGQSLRVSNTTTQAPTEEVPEPEVVAPTEDTNVNTPVTPTPAPTLPENTNNTNSTVHVVKAGEWVSKIAAQYGITDSQLRQWNNLSSDLIHPGDRLVVSKSASKPVEDNTQNNNTNTGSQNNGSSSAKTYTVKSGDYLYSIATNYGVSVQNLKDWNNLTSNYIYVGNVLNVSNPTTSTPAPKPEPKPEVKPDEKEDSSQTVTNKYHTVKAGESVGIIAAKYNVTVAQIREWNKLSSDLIHPGDKLVVSKKTVEVPKEEKPTTDDKDKETGNVEKPSEAKTHTVKSGESVGIIAAKYNVTVAQVREWNNLKSDLIHPGDKLVVSKGTVEVPKEEKPTTDNKDKETGNTEKPTESTEVKTYTVKSGDYLYAIATRHNVSVQNLIDWNDLTSNYIYVGNKLIVSKPVDKVVDKPAENDKDKEVEDKPVVEDNNKPGDNTEKPNPDLSTVTQKNVNYDVKLNGKTEKIRSSLSYTGRTVDAVDYFGQRFTIKREFVAEGVTYLELLTANGATLGYVPKSAAVEVPQAKNVVYIDAGHGGSETGSRANGRNEKDLNLNITNQLSDILRNQGYIVYETRDNDKTVDLRERQLEPNEIMPDAYISIHHNAMPIPGTAQGIVTLYHDPSIDEPGYLTMPHHHGTNIISEGKRLSQSIQDSLIGATGAVNQGIRPQNLHVTRTTDVPATLVELGFQDHYGEFQKLVNPTYQKKLINGLVNGINAYFGHTK